MPNWGAVGIGGIILLLGLAIVMQHSRMSGLRDEVDTLNSKLRRLEAAPEPAAGDEPASRSDLSALKAEIARVEKKNDARVEAFVNPPPGGGALTLIKEEDIQQIIDDRLEEKLQARSDLGGGGGGEGGGDKKVQLDDLAEQLNLPPQTQTQVEDVANRTKKEIFDLLRTPRGDNTTIADELLDAMASGEQDRMGAIFLKLFTDKVPGRDETYAAAVGVIQDRARLNLKGVMGDAPYRKFSGMNVKPENILTGFDPWAEYMQQRNN